MLALNSGHTISNIEDPDLIGPEHGKLPLHAIRGNHSRPASNTTRSFIAEYGCNPVQLHNTTHQVFAAGLPDLIQIALNPTIAIDPTAQGI